MSGGHFNYDQFKINEIADELEEIIKREEDPSSEYHLDFKYPQTMQEFKKGLEILRMAYVYAQRIDWLISADDGEDTFHRRLQEELNKL